MDKRLLLLKDSLKISGWVYDDPELNIFEFIRADNERAARIYFKDLITNELGRTAYKAKYVRRYEE